MAPPQRIVFALLVQTLQGYRSDRFMVVFGFVMMPFFAVAGFLGGLFAMTAAHVLLAALSRWADIDLEYALYAIPLFILLFAHWHKSLEREREIVFHFDDGRVDGLELGRLHEIFETSEPSTLGLFLGICFGAQVGLLQFTPDHAGLPILGGFAESALLTLNNACHGIFLDTFELYNLDWGKKPEHNYWSATIFYVFRLAFDAFALLYVYGAYRRYRLRLLFQGFPNDPRRVDEFLDWIEARCGDKHRWPRHYFDEFLFLTLAKEYLRGNLTLVRQVSLQFPNLTISDDVRAAFVGPTGDVVFRGMVASKSRAATLTKDDPDPLD
ncbi:hypothetical protein SAMN05444166_0045 [Singulisphaera sp. GP187]|uniref:hypothetical protein n=1 Tax=Singulisphaera sp. GP187 TaxID=1882752 RepID=UPI00092BB8E2|nr:hypothetical protein [Singulisphaera sp. GP187]SIN67997.1 hypothetical protein SAMN05444166_0045 [Singulisphaera sp. GP187]